MDPVEHIDTIQIARKLARHARSHRLAPRLTDLGIVAACAVALNQVHGIDPLDKGRFAVERRWFGMADAQAWEKHSVYALCVDGQVMDYSGAVGWDQILCSQPLTKEEAQVPEGMPVNRQWLGDSGARLSGLEACRDLGSRSGPMLDLAQELCALVGAWRMGRDTLVVDEPAPKARRM